MDEALVWEMRGIIANYLSQNKEQFQAFADEPIEGIIKHKILKMYTEAEQLVVELLPQSLRIKVVTHLLYLEEGELVGVVRGNESEVEEG